MPDNEVIRIDKGYFDVMNATIARLHIQLEDARLNLELISQKMKEADSRNQSLLDKIKGLQCPPEPTGS